MQKKTLLTAMLAAGFALSVQAEQFIDPIIVTATRTEFRDTEAPYATEVHRRVDIIQSGATSLYDYLDRHSSVIVMPAFGNPFVQKLDMRGYGIGDGYQNIVIMLNGRRLNNIDMVPQLLSATPLDSIERIEISKGSGSVLFGDGAMAGTINIITRDINGASIQLRSGNHGMSNSSVSAGFTQEHAALSVSAENYRHDGYRDEDASAKKDRAHSNNLQAMLTMYPHDRMELRAGKTLSWIDTVYGNSLSKDEFKSNPTQSAGSIYNGQRFQSDSQQLGLSAEINSAFRLVIDHHTEEKSSDFYVPFNWRADYDYQTSDLALHYQSGATNLITGLQRFNGERTQIGSKTEKNNLAYFVQGHYRLQATTLSAGARQETVRYGYHPDGGSRLSDKEKLNAWDIGVNHRIDPALSVFGNLNAAYQAPDIDRFFNFDGTFNDFISPARSRTLNLGMNHETTRHRLKLSLFYSRLNNEIYYYDSGNYNTNIDKSHKYGLELQEHYRFNAQLSGSVNYAWTRAVIDREDEGGGSYDGKQLPGVSEHSVVVGLRYTPTAQSSLMLNHSWRSEAHAANDFANNFSQKQATYHSTDIGYSYRIEQFELFARIDNLFDHVNGLWIQDDAIYPVNFTRSWRLGLRAEF